jgi:hypothetical protein
MYRHTVRVSERERERETEREGGTHLYWPVLPLAQAVEVE